ncbi:CaiB/BaiF CoA transferase family protein [Natrinema caseinilyticum]|uniref:CaiB/BaiF CoA transferase family protein n=1 Tax=Natrinema caseinilyticum TaxID=2961570 RepID=UPI0020C55141|nr:CaiB/BaiF CoA-transferase family protein [Natrinema caseinilyticum]
MELDGIRIVDLTRLLPGPYATQLLADMGAEVIKVEDPNVGDYARFTEPMAPNDVGAVFSAVNRGKKSVTIDLKDDAGLEAFYELIADADAVIEQFRPGVAERLEVGYESVREHNPDVVYCSLSGYGQDGPYRNRVGHDLNYASVAGLVDMTREDEDEKPAIPGYPIGDMAGGTFAALSVVSSLLSRALGNEAGNYVDVSMTEAVLSFSQAVAPLALYGGDPRPGETELTGTYPCYDVYRTADDRFVSIAALEPKFWEILCTELDREELIENHRAEDEATRAAVRETLAETFRSKTQSEWEDELGETDAMFAPVRTPREAVNDPQIRSREIVTDADGPMPRIGFPAASRHGLAGSGDDVPEMGEHTAEVLEAVGVDEDAIDELRARDVV